MAENMIPKWEDSMPVATPDVPKWEDSKPVDNRLFSPTKDHQEALKRSFGGDPLAFIDVPQIKADMEFQLMKSGDVENEKKKWALAAYFANGNKEDIRFCHGNLESFIEKFNDGKPQSVDATYNAIAAMLNPPQPGDGGTLEVMKAIGSGLMKNASDYFFSALKLATNDPGQDAMNKMLLDEKSKKAYDSGVAEFDKGLDDTHKKVRGYFKDVADTNTALALDEEWVSRWNNGRWLVNAGKFLAIQAPQQAVQIATAYYMGPMGFTMAIGGSSGIDKYYDLKWDNPDLTAEQRMKNATLTAFINSGMAWLTAGIVKGKIPGLNKIQVQNEAKASILYFMESIGMEAGQEIVEQIAENATDLHTGVYGDVDKMSPEEYRDHLWNNLGESALAGGVFGGGAAGTGHRSFRQQQQFNNQLLNSLKAEKGRLLQVENPTDAEIAQLDQLNTALDSGNVNQLAAVAQGVADLEMERQRIAQDRKAELTDEERLQEAADNGALDWAIRQQLPHNPQDTINTANDLMQLFPAFKLDVIYYANELPSNVAARIESDGLSLERIRAWVDNSDTIHLVAANVRPSDVAQTIGHEIIGHKGLRAVFKERFDTFLDGVYRDHFEEVQRLSESYNRDTETEANQRYLTEEFLSNCASTEVKPSWWKEFLQQIKMTLRKLPGLQNLRFTDREIEAALMRSARAMHKKNAKNMPLDANIRLLAQDKDNGKIFSKRNAANYSKALTNLRSIQGHSFINEDTGIEARLSSTGVGKLLSGAARDKSKANGFSDAQHFEAASNIDRLYENAVLLESRPDRENDPNIASIKRFSAPFYINGEFAEAYITAKENTENGHRIYSLELDEIKKPSEVIGDRLDPYHAPSDGNLPESQEDMTKQYPASESYNKLQQKIEKARALLKKNADSQGVVSDISDDGEGTEVGLRKSSLASQAEAEAEADSVTTKESVRFSQKLDHSQYQENTMLDGEKRIPLVTVDPKWSTVGEAQAELARKIKDGKGKITILNQDQNMPILIQTHDSLDEAGSEQAMLETATDGTTAEIHAAALRNIEPLLSMAKLGVSHRDWHVYAKNKTNGSNRESALQVHRFYTAMAYGNDVYGVQMTVREKRSGNTVFYTLETHNLNIQKITPETEAPGGGVAKAALPVQSPEIQFSAFFEKFKPYDDLLGFKYKEKYPDVQFSIAEYSSADQNDIIAILRPFVGQTVVRKDSDYANYLAGKGVNISERDAHRFAVLASLENVRDAKKHGEQRRDNWLYENVPFWREAVDFCGGMDFKIRPSLRFKGEEFPGTFIAKKKEGGMNSDELAEAIARKWGRDSLEVEQELVDFFRNLKKPDLYKMYSDWKKENVLGDRESEKRMWEEWDKQEQAQIEEEVIELLTNGKPITEEWIWDNRKIYNELYKQLFDGKAAPYNPGKKDLESINAALIQQGANAGTFAQAYKIAREKAYGEFMDKLREFKEKVMNSKADAVKLQRDALKFAEENLPQEHRGEFSRAIVGLMEFPASPSVKYPEGRRAAEFRNLFDQITRRSAELRRASALNEIKSMLDTAKIKGNYKGIPTSVLPSEQNRIDRIRQIVNLNLSGVVNLIEYNNSEISRLEDSGENSIQLENFQADNVMLHTFGNLHHRSAEDAEVAAKVLKDLISGGKSKFKEKLQTRKAEVDEMRRRAVDDATFGKNEYQLGGDAKKHNGYWLKNEPLGTLMRISSGKSIQDFDSSVFGELYRKVEASTQAEQTGLRRMQQDLDAALRDIAGIDGKTAIERMRKKGKFFRSLSEEVKHSGVFKTEYTRSIKTGTADFVFEHGRRGLVKKSIPVEDYQWYGNTRKGARSILHDIDHGESISTWDGMLLDDTAIAFLRQQLADFDAGLKQSYEIFNDESDDANFNRMLEEERQASRLLVFTHEPDEISSKVEVPLSQGAALQILLTWEQEHYQPNMKWNGWTAESMEQLRKFIKPEVAQMGHWMRDYIAKNKTALDDKVFERYGARLPLNDKYFPAAFRGGKTMNIEGSLGRGAGSMSINPNFLIARKFHLKPVDTDGDAFSSFMGNQLEQNHFLAWSDTMRDLKSVYGGAMVQKAINDNFGVAVTQNIIERIDVIARGGGKFSENYAFRIFRKLYRYCIPAKIAINASSAMKQMFGVTAYMNRMPMVDFARNMAGANFSNPEFREFVKWARNTDYFKNRMAGGLDKDLQYLLNYTRDSKAYSPLSDALLQIGTWQTKWSDAWSSLHGGFAVYKYNLDQAKKSGMSNAEAHEAAQLAWQRSTDETQQSGYLKDQNFFQSNQDAYRYLTAFLTNPIQVMNLQLQTVNEIRYGSDKKAAWQKFGKQVLVNHLIIPTLMQFTNDILRAGFNIPDWWDELEFEDYLLAWGLGQFEGAFLFGKAVNSLWDALVKKQGFFNAGISAVPLLDDLGRDAATWGKLFGDDDLTEKDLFDGIKALGDVGMAVGMADNRAGSIGAILYAIGAQGKRIAKWLNPEK